MEYAIGMRDVLKVLHSEGAKLNEVQLLPKDMDCKVLPILQAMGIDVREQFTIDVKKYRDMDNKVGIGYRYVGTMRLDKEWLDCKLCCPMLRIAATAYFDNSLTTELCQLVGTARDLTVDALVDAEDSEYDLTSDTYTEDSDKIRELINVLKEVRKID